VQFLAVLVVLLLATDWIGHRWLFERGTLAGTDILLAKRDRPSGKHCRLVTISEAEYNKYLGECIETEKLEAVLKALLAYHPRVLAIDIDTSAPRFASLRIPSTETKIVWARVSHQVGEKDASGKRTYSFKVGEVLGNRPAQPEFIGSPLFIMDPDGVVREFARKIQVNARPETLPWTMVRAYCEEKGKKACAAVREDESEQPREYGTDWDVWETPLSDVLAHSTSDRPDAGELDVMVLGGNFNDLHETPFGTRLGIELIAFQFETELAGEPEPPAVLGWSKWIIKLSLALAVAWLNHRLMPRWAAISMLLLLTLVFFASFLGIYYRIFRLEFLPFMIGLWIEQLVEGAEHAQPGH